MSRKVKEEHINPTMVIIDADNLIRSLEEINLRIFDIKVFINNFLEKKDRLTGLKNRDGDSFMPVSYVVGEIMGGGSDFQKKELNKFKKKFGNFLDIFLVTPKKGKGGYWVNLTDAQIISLISLALNDSEIRKILIISGDGDFLIPLETIGVAGKQIFFVGIKGSVSGELDHFLKGRRIGDVTRIERSIPGLKAI